MTTKARQLTRICFRAGQVVCMLLALLVATQIIGGVVWELTGGPSLAPVGVAVIQAPPMLQIPGVILFCVSRVLVLALLLQLFRLLGSFAGGETYASGTVRRLYVVGFLVVAAGTGVKYHLLLGWALTSLGLLDQEFAVFDSFASIVTQLMGPVIVGGAVLLGARVLDEVRRLREQADQLRREADLVV